MPYEKQTWAAGQAGGTPLSPPRLNYIESGIGNVTAAVDALIAGVPGAFDTLLKIANAIAASQPVDSDLTAIAALSTTAYGRDFLAFVDAAAGRTALGLGTAATAPTTAFDGAGAAAAALAASQAADALRVPLAAKDQPGGYPGLDAAGLLAEPQIPPSIARDTEVAAAASAATLAFLPNTAYAAGKSAINPAGELVKRLVAGTSGAAYNPADWTAPASAIYERAPTIHFTGEGKPNGLLAGDLDSGQPWLTKGSLPDPILVNGKITYADQSVGSAAYFGAQLPAGALVRRMGMEWTFGPGNTSGSAVMIPWAENVAATHPRIPNTAAHLSITPSTWGVLVIENNVNRSIGGGSFTPLAQDNTTVHRAEMLIQGSTLTILLPNDKIVTVTDPAIASMPRPFAFWEVFQSNGSANAKASFTRLWADTVLSPVGVSTPASVGVLFASGGPVKLTATNIGVGGGQASLTTGANNNAVGTNAQFALTAGTNNNAFGTSTQSQLTTGGSNNALGTNAQNGLTTGGSNSAIGMNAQLSITTGGGNNAIGAGAQQSLTTGLSNVGIGTSAQQAPLGVAANATTTANSQTCIGVQTGQSAAVQVNEITCIGTNATAGAVAATALGVRARADHAGSVALGSDTLTTATSQVMVGPRNVEHALGYGPIIKSPNGTRYRVTVADGGVLSTVAA